MMQLIYFPFVKSYTTNNLLYTNFLVFASVTSPRSHDVAQRIL